MVRGVFPDYGIPESLKQIGACGHCGASEVYNPAGWFRA